MSYDFELIITIIGLFVMTLTISIIILTSELLKRLFKGEDDTKGYEAPLMLEELSEQAIITAALMTYIRDTPQKHQQNTTFKNSNEQPPIWNMASRMELMGLQNWRKT